jgi:hypothetical protein
VAALAVAGLSGLDALHLHIAVTGFPEESMRQVRGSTPGEWAAARESLVARGLLDGDGLTSAGAALVAEVEEMTDELAWQGGLAAAPIDEVTGVLAPSVAALWDAGVVPQANPIGVARA